MRHKKLVFALFSIFYVLPLWTNVKKLPNLHFKISNFFLVSDEGICPPEFKYVYDGGRKCCQFPYEDNDELNLLQFNSRQCQSNATLDCPFAEGCDDCEFFFH